MSRKYGTDKDIGVIPKIGRILVFQHDILHEGSELVRGTKFTMRTDVMYAVPEQFAPPEEFNKPHRPPGLQEGEEAPENLSKSALKNKKRREAAKNKAKLETTETVQTKPETNNDCQEAKGILSDLEKEKKIRTLNKKIQSIQKIKQALAEGKPLEKNQIEKLYNEQELLDQLEALKLS